MPDLHIEYIPVGDITPYEKNARKHQDEDLKAIIASIQEFGFDDPIGIWSDKNIIVEGHGRLMAAKALHMTEVPCIRLDHLTDEQRKAYALAHNKTAELSEWDFDILGGELDGILDIDMSQFGFTVDDEPTPDTAQEDDFDPMPPAEPKSKPGQIYKLGEHVLMCGDSTKAEDVAKLMGDAMADLVVTDPPYNVGYAEFTSVEEAKKLKRRTDGLTVTNDNLADQDFLDMLVKAFQSMYLHMRNGAAFYIWHAPTEQKTFEEALNKNDLYIRQQLIWVKNRMVLGRQDYQWRHEPCFYGWKSGAGHYYIDDYSQTTVIEDTVDYKSMKKEDLVQILSQLTLCNSTVIYEDKPATSDLHPTMKPIKLLARLIHNSSRTGETVLDLFGGSGSTLIACEQLNRKCYMMEYEPKYVDVIIDRWEKFTGQKAELIQDV